jgi:hypothetical protein
MVQLEVTRGLALKQLCSLAHAQPGKKKWTDFYKRLMLRIGAKDQVEEAAVSQNYCEKYLCLS